MVAGGCRIDMDKKTRYTLVGKTGNEIFSANSFLGYIGGLVVIAISSVFVLLIIAAIICGIASVFK